MFNVGDKVVYPMQGIGIVQRIEEKLFCGKKKKYCIIQMLKNNLEIMIPIDRLPNSKLRMINDINTLEDILNNIGDTSNPEEADLPSKQRYEINLNKIKSGLLEDSLDVFYNLTLINKNKALNSTEKQILNTAQKFLIDEIRVIKDISENEATKILKSSIN
ncbi:transcription factor YdeB [Clostridium botulinum]|uniref:Transcription factor YdeB n=1 Tax=Clostridium botulinum TaxID=1491 RepID=A0A0C2SJ44_CLOBO|nr:MULTISPECIES: CarD family transcriptional regulator [Clostridium]ACD53896.1 transcriptional regulator, CarD family [Clostridium botulinum E3 str. Alaska E43]AJF29007.1 transcription factor YdeB [Clostridium botulinum]AJF32068.1 transcription factor YdeB [Clostridium botulinum]KAI3350342.1 transcription factor YdeB [Clostridium botulinum]KIL09201.1 transcription factor YdeB [Clostridium botulinum]